MHPDDRAAVDEVLALYCEPIDEYAVTYVTASHELPDGSRWRVGLRYVDVLVRRDPPSGVPERCRTGWAIAERALVATLVEDGPPDGWTWVPPRRHEPD